MANITDQSAHEPNGRLRFTREGMTAIAGSKGKETIILRMPIGCLSTLSCLMDGFVTPFRSQDRGAPCSSMNEEV
jgi:hypothetical protein